MKKILILIIVLYLNLNVKCQPIPGTLNPLSAVTLIGKQRLISQKITNAKLFLINEIQVEKFKKEYDNGLLIFDENLKNLLKYAPSKNVKKKLEMVGLRWTQYKETCETADTSKLAVSNLMTNSNLLFSLTEDAMAEMIRYAYDVNTQNSEEYRDQETISKQISVVSRIRINSVKIPIFYNLFVGEYDVTNQKSITRAFEVIQGNFAVLSAAEINTNTIDGAIANALVEWNNFKTKYLKKGTYQFLELQVAPQNLYDDLVVFQSKLDKITFAYVSLVQR